MSDVGRRRVLRTGVTVATSLGIAGTTGALRSNASRSPTALDRPAAQDDRGIAPYADWIPDPSAEPATAALRGVWHYEMDALLTLEDQGEGPSDPMLMNAISAGAFSVFLWLELDEVGLAEPIVGPAAAQQDVDPETVPADTGLIIGGAQVYLGSFDGAELQGAVDAGAFSEAAAGIYAHDEQDLTVAWGDGYVVVGSDEAVVDVLVRTKEGDVDRRHEVDADFEWLLRTAGHGDFSLARLSESETIQLSEQDDTTDTSMFEGSKGFAQSASSDDGELAGATTAVVYASEDRVDRDRLESNLGTQATDRTVDRNGATVTIDASYEGGGQSDDGSEDGDGSDGGNEDDDTDDGSDGQNGDGGDGSDEQTTDDDGGDDGNEDGDGGGGGNEDDDTGDDGDSTPAPGVLGTVASIGAAGYLLSRRRGGAE